MQHDTKTSIKLDVAHENKVVDDVAYLEGVDSVLSVYKEFCYRSYFGQPI